MYEEYDRVLSFCSVRHAIRAEELLVKCGIKVASVPKPREIDINCGQCILFLYEQENEVMAILQNKNVFWAELYSRDGKNKVYEKIAEYEEKTN